LARRHEFLIDCHQRPSGLDARGFRRATRVDARHNNHVTRETHVHSCVATSIICALILQVVETVSHVSGNEGKVRLAQSGEHPSDYSAQLILVIDFGGNGAQLVPHTKPINAVERRVEVGLVDYAPCRIERLEPDGWVVLRLAPIV
jgi:hypothetical protein